MLHIDNPKYCWAWNRIYVKANGRIPCWCDAGERYTIIHRSLEDYDFVRDIVNSDEMRRMRTKILIQNEYFIKECETCCCMLDVSRGVHSRFENDKNPNLIDKREAAQKVLSKRCNKDKPSGWIDNIAEIQIEPSFPCNLKCPACLHGSHKNPLSTEPKPHILPLDWFKRIIDSIIFNKTRVGRIAFVGRGEPTLNINFSNMIEYARTALPDLTISMDTNANQPFKNEYRNLTWINCSIDGSNQKSYEKYRVGGVFEKTQQFMRDGVAAGGVKIRWKYILFDSTHDEVLMNQAQTKAKEIGIDELFFVITNFGGANIKPSDNFKTVAKVNDYIKKNPIFHNTRVSYAT